MKSRQTYQMVHVAIFAALAVILMFFDFPLPFFPPFLKFDTSDAIVFISHVFVGPLGMLAIIFLRSLLHWILRGAETGIPIGQLATILSSATFCLTTYYIMQKLKRVHNKQQKLILGLVVGTLAMTVVMFIANYFWVTPFYFALGQIPLPPNYSQYMLIYIPFNLLKGAINSLLIYFLLPYTPDKRPVKINQ